MYAAATLELYGPAASGGGGSGGDAAAAVTEWWWRIVELLYGGPPAVSGAKLVLALARPCSLLLVLQLYRWAEGAAGGKASTNRS
jgi:hypothetical protein